MDVLFTPDRRSGRIETKTGKSLEQGADGDLGLEAAEGSSDTEMNARAERQMWIAAPIEIK